MPTPTLTTEQLMEAITLWASHGRSVEKAAQASGLNHYTYKSRVYEAKKRGLHLSPGVQAILQRAKIAPLEARGGWIHNYADDGKKIGATYWKSPEDEQYAPRIAQIVRETLEGIKPADPVIPPEKVSADLCNLIPLFDVHWGMHSWGEETGGDDYDLKLAEADLVQAFERVLGLMPYAEEGVLLIGGDFFHADDNSAQTPASKHSLDVDGRIHKVIKTAIRVLAYVVQRMQSKHRKTIIRVLRGNHDEHSYLPLAIGLDERFRNDSSVFVDDSPRDLFMHQWGRTAIFGHHGDKTKPVDFVLKLADACPFWTEAPYRYAYTGHKHKFAAERIGGVYWEQLDAFCPPDSYGSRWVSRRGLKGETFHRQSGRVLTAHDPLERAA